MRLIWTNPPRDEENQKLNKYKSFSPRVCSRLWGAKFLRSRPLTCVDQSHERLDLPGLAERERRRRIVRRSPRCPVFVQPKVSAPGFLRSRIGVDGNARGVVAPVLQPPQAIKKHLQYVSPLPRDIVVEVGEDPAHGSLPPSLCLPPSSASPPLRLSPFPPVPDSAGLSDPTRPMITCKDRIFIKKLKKVTFFWGGGRGEGDRGGGILSWRKDAEERSRFFLGSRRAAAWETSRWIQRRATACRSAVRRGPLTLTAECPDHRPLVESSNGPGGRSDWKVARAHTLIRWIK